MTNYQHGRVMPAHTGVTGHPFGDTVYVLVACNGSVYGPWRDQHTVAKAHASGLNGFFDPDWLEPQEIPVGALRIPDIHTPSMSTFRT